MKKRIGVSITLNLPITLLENPYIAVGRNKNISSSMWANRWRRGIPTSTVELQSFRFGLSWAMEQVPFRGIDGPQHHFIDGVDAAVNAICRGSLWGITSIWCIRVGQICSICMEHLTYSRIPG